MKFSEWILVKENSQLSLPFKSKNPSNVSFSGWIKDGRIFANIDGQKKTFVTDAIYHNKLKKMKPIEAYKQILKLIDKNIAYELEKNNKVIE